jgi:MOSC domain-containing protein YiiM
MFAGFLDVPDMVRRFTAARRPGCYLAVEREGDVSSGDPVRVLLRPGHGVTVTDVMAAMSGERERLPRVRHAAAHLGVRGQKWLAGVGG